MADLARLAERFRNAREFDSSPLYKELCSVVAHHDFALRLASNVQNGQQPTFMFFAAVHYLLLKGNDHELAAFYPSIVGDAAQPPERGRVSLFGLLCDL